MLRRLLSPRKQAHSVVQDLALTLGGLTVEDARGELLAGLRDAADSSRTEVKAGGQTQGWVLGAPAHAKLLARVLEQLLAQELDSRALSAELLDNYRELNLLYSLADHLISTPEPQAIARLALEEAGRLIPFVSGAVLLGDEADDLRNLALAGPAMILSPENNELRTLLRDVLTGGEAEVRNGWPSASLWARPCQADADVLCAPLKTEQRAVGVLLLAGEVGAYTTHELKLLRAIALQAAPALEMARLYQIAVDKGRLERELQLGRELQASLIPAQNPAIAGWEFAGRWLPARELSGDYYDLIEEPGGRLSMVIGDVAGKGLPSSLFMVFVRTAVRSAISTLASPADIIAQANELVVKESHNGLFVTLLYARLDKETGTVHYVNAGHNPALVYEQASGHIRSTERTGIPLGILPAASYREAREELARGDILLVYTDGITEALNARGEEFGMRRLEELLRQNGHCAAELVADAIEAAVLDFTGEQPLFDDVTLLVARRQD